MEHFWIGFEKAAGVAGLGNALGSFGAKLRMAPAQAMSAAKTVAKKPRQFSQAVGEGYKNTKGNIADAIHREHHFGPFKPTAAELAAAKNRGKKPWSKLKTGLVGAGLGAGAMAAYSASRPSGGQEGSQQMYQTGQMQ